MRDCDECGGAPATGEDGLCAACREELAAYYRGALCARCDVELTVRGFCPNDRCPFHDTYQDELGPYDLPTPEERSYIRRVVIPRLAGERPGDLAP